MLCLCRAGCTWVVTSSRLPWAHAGLLPSPALSFEQFIFNKQSLYSGRRDTRAGHAWYEAVSRFLKSTWILCFTDKRHLLLTRKLRRRRHASTVDCQFTDFVKYKRLFLVLLETFGDWRESMYRSYSSQRAAGAGVGPCPIPKHSQAAESSHNGPSSCSQSRWEMSRDVHPSESRLLVNGACAKPPLADPVLTYSQTNNLKINWKKIDKICSQFLS